MFSAYDLFVGSYDLLVVHCADCMLIMCVLFCDVAALLAVFCRRGGCPISGQMPYPGHLGNPSWRWSFVFKF